MASAVVEARNLRKQFGAAIAVDGISFTVRAGECYGLLGPNGAGKTSTFRMLCCVSPLSGGELTVLGLDVRRDQRAIKAQLGVAPQDNNLDPDLSVEENLLVYARYYDLPSKVARERADRALQLFQLTDRRKAEVQYLSGGMKRRLVLARALVNDPKLLVLDEPTTGLDPQARLIIWQTVRQLQSEGVTVMLSTHYMEEASSLCDRLAIMSLGKILVEGAPSALIAEYAGAEVVEIPLLGRPLSEVERAVPSGMMVQDLGNRAVVMGPGIDDVGAAIQSLGLVAVRRAATLEDVFIRLTGTALGGEGA